MTTKSKSTKKTTAPKTVSKTAASAAKKEVLARLKDNKDASVGLGKNDNGDYVVVVKFAKKPSKKLLAALSKGLSVEIRTEVVETAVALSTKEKSLPTKEKALTTSKLLPESLLVNLTQGILKAVKQAAKKTTSKKATPKKTKSLKK